MLRHDTFFGKYISFFVKKVLYNFYHQNTLLDAFRTNSRNIIGRNPSMVIPFFFFFFFFFINLKRKTQQHLTYRYSYLCLSQQKKTRSHRVSAMRDTYNSMAFTMKITLHKIRSAKPWSNQPSTLSFVRWFQEFPKGIEKV